MAVKVTRPNLAFSLILLGFFLLTIEGLAFTMYAMRFMLARGWAAPMGYPFFYNYFMDDGWIWMWVASAASLALGLILLQWEIRKS